MLTIIHNPRCSKSREVFNYLKENEIPFDVVDYLKQPLSKEDLQIIIKKLQIPARELIRTNEAIFKENFKGKILTEEEWIDAMVAHPSLIERPILVKDDRAVIGRPLENIKSLI